MLFTVGSDALGEGLGARSVGQTVDALAATSSVDSTILEDISK